MASTISGAKNATKAPQPTRPVASGRVTKCNKSSEAVPAARRSARLRARIEREAEAAGVGTAKPGSPPKPKKKTTTTTKKKKKAPAKNNNKKEEEEETPSPLTCSRTNPTPEAAATRACAHQEEEMEPSSPMSWEHTPPEGSAEPASGQSGDDYGVHGWWRSPSPHHRRLLNMRFEDVLMLNPGFAVMILEALSTERLVLQSSRYSGC